MSTELPSSDAALYARSFGDVYDSWYGELDDPSFLVSSFAQRLPHGATIVEFGGGTGRLALPLSNAGYHVISLDISHSMLGVASETVTSAAADIASIPLHDGCADAVLIAYNTLFNLDEAPTQQQCIGEACRILRPGGLLALECFVAPSGQRADFGISTRPHPTQDGAQLAILSGPSALADQAAIVGSHIELVGDRAICRPWRLAYHSPAELDAFARSAGLELAGRAGDWSGSPFDEDSDRHVSWYLRPT